jgi:hypothetical protein
VYYDRRLMKQKLSICVEGGGLDEWAFCNWKNHTIGENEFIRTYHNITGSPRFDGLIDESYKRTPLIIVGSLSAAFLIFMIAGYASLGNDIGAGFGVGGFGTAALFFTTVIGWPLAVRQPRYKHKMPKNVAQAAVDEYNRTLFGQAQAR